MQRRSIATSLHFYMYCDREMVLKIISTSCAEVLSDRLIFCISNAICVLRVYVSNV
jgi:hypothetical protein